MVAQHVLADAAGGLARAVGSSEACARAAGCLGLCCEASEEPREDKAGKAEAGEGG